MTSYLKKNMDTALPDCAVERYNHYTIKARNSKRWYTKCELWFNIKICMHALLYS